MLSIGKLAGGAEGYYLRAVAGGVEDYYLGSGEAPGRWVGAGSPRLLVRRLDPVVLRTNHRQEQPWERVALDKLRAGDVPAALAAYDHHGRLHVHDTVEDQRAALVTAWWEQTSGHLATELATSRATDLAPPTAPGDGPVLMLAARRADVDDLNRRARTLMAAHGHLTGPVSRSASNPARTPHPARARSYAASPSATRSSPAPTTTAPGCSTGRPAPSWPCTPPPAPSTSAPRPASCASGRRIWPSAASTTATRSPSTGPRA